MSRRQEQKLSFQGPPLGQGICGVGGVCLLASLDTATGIYDAAFLPFTATRSASTRAGIARYCMYVQHGWLVGGKERHNETYVES